MPPPCLLIYCYAKDVAVQNGSKAFPIGFVTGDFNRKCLSCVVLDISKVCTCTFLSPLEVSALESQFEASETTAVCNKITFH